MKILVLNAGAGSQRCSLFEVPDKSLPDAPLDPVWEAKLDSTAPDQPKGKLRVWVVRRGERIEAPALDNSVSAIERIEYLLRLLCEEPAKVVHDFGEINAAGHRIVHGGAEFSGPALVTSEVEAVLSG